MLNLKVETREVKAIQLFLSLALIVDFIGAVLTSIVPSPHYQEGLVLSILACSLTTLSLYVKRKTKIISILMSSLISTLLIYLSFTMLYSSLVVLTSLLSTLFKLDALGSLRLFKKPIPLPMNEKLINYLKEKPQALSIIQFMILLIYSAILLSCNNYFLSERFAECAYFFLVVGVLTALITTIRQKNIMREHDDV